MRAGGSVASTRLTLPRDPFVSGEWQMLLGGGVCLLTGAVVGEFGDLDPAKFSSRSLIACACGRVDVPRPLRRRSDPRIRSLAYATTHARHGALRAGGPARSRPFSRS